jgi:ethanolamine ammonia-lyase small subunit
MQRNPCDLVIVVGDGLSSQAVQRHAPALVKEIVARLPNLSLGPVVIAQQARVAIADDIGERLSARAAVVLIGERPGLSTNDSLGLYLTLDPHIGRSDAERNCISNVHKAGLSYAAAADQFVWLLRESFRLGVSGVGLTDARLKDVQDGRRVAQLPADDSGTTMRRQTPGPHT